MSLMIPAWVNGVLTPVEKLEAHEKGLKHKAICLLYTSPSPRDRQKSRMPSSA